LQQAIEARTQQHQQAQGDEYERWRSEPALPENHALAQDLIRYWQLKQADYLALSKFAIDILSIPASAANCERTFSELGDMLGTRRLNMKPEMINALQCLKGWRRLLRKQLASSHTTEELQAIQSYLSTHDYI